MKDLQEKIEAVIAYLEKHYDPNFDYEVEHWDWGNADDSFSYGCDSGTNAEQGKLLGMLKE